MKKNWVYYMQEGLKSMWKKKEVKKVNPRKEQMEQYTHNPAYPGPSLDKECGCLPDCGCKE
jgi:hypothetical protein|tara:strand:- start:177 stop:359 length:183 start_codon:yes stop_codon:yes gene_type:complete